MPQTKLKAIITVEKLSYCLVSCKRFFKSVAYIYELFDLFVSKAC